MNADQEIRVVLDGLGLGGSWDGLTLEFGYVFENNWDIILGMSIDCWRKLKFFHQNLISNIRNPF